MCHVNLVNARSTAGSLGVCAFCLLLFVHYCVCLFVSISGGLMKAGGTGTRPQIVSDEACRNGKRGKVCS